MRLLSDVVSEADSKMTASNLAAIFTPNILRPFDEDPKTKERASMTTGRELTNHSSSVNIVEMLIVHHELIGLVPRDIEGTAAGLDAVKAKARYQRVILPRRGCCLCLGGARKDGNQPSKAEVGRRKMSHLTSQATLDMLHGSSPVSSASACSVNLNTIKVLNIPERLVVETKKERLSVRDFGVSVAYVPIFLPPVDVFLSFLRLSLSTLPLFIFYLFLFFLPSLCPLFSLSLFAVHRAPDQ